MVDPRVLDAVAALEGRWAGSLGRAYFASVEVGSR